MRISPINLKILAYTLDVEGFDSRSAVQAVGYAHLDEIPEDGEWLDVAVFDRMMHAAIDLTGDPLFGLTAGKSIALMKYGAITPLALSTPCLRQLLIDIQRFGRLAVARSEIELVESDKVCKLVVQPVVQGGLSGNFRLEQVATSAVQMLRFCGAAAHDIHEIDFPHALDEACAERYRSAFGHRLNFRRRECAVHFNPTVLDTRMPVHDPVAYMAARTRAESLLTAQTARTDLAERVRQWLLNAMPALPSVADTANSLGMSERSFRRQLRMLDTSHEALLQECQKLTAERLLAEGRLPLKQVAEALGFASVPSFHRAFRRWTGLTPTAWKDLRCSDAPS